MIAEAYDADTEYELFDFLAPGKKEFIQSIIFHRLLIRFLIIIINKQFAMI